MSVREWFGIAGTSDGTATGTTSIARIVSGVVSVVAGSSDAILTTIDTVLDNIYARFDVALSTRASQATVATLATQATAAAAAASLVAIDADLDVALSTRASQATVATLATQATAASILVDTGTIAGDTTSIDGKTPALGQGLMAASVPVVVASNQSSMPVTEASAAGILADTAAIETATVATQAACEKIDDWDAVHNVAAGADGCRQMLTAYADPSTLPADVGADGRDVRAVGSRKGVAYVSLPDNIEGEDATNHVMKVEGQFSYAYLTAEAQVKGSAGFVHAIHIECTTAGTVTIYNSLTEVAPVVDQFIMAINTRYSDTPDVICGTGIYIGFDATFAGSVRVSYR